MAAAVAAAFGGSALAASGTWTGTSGLWSDTANWSGGIVATGASSASGGAVVVSQADFSTLALSANQTVSLDSARTIGGLVFGDTDATPNNWTLDNNGVATNRLTLQGNTYYNDGATTGDDRPFIKVNNGQATISAGLIQGSSPNHQWVKQGNGTLVISGTVTGAAGFVIQNGTSTSPSTVTFNNPSLSFGTASTSNNFNGYYNVVVASALGEVGVLNLQAGTVNAGLLNLGGDGNNGSGTATLNLSGGKLNAAAVGSASNDQSGATVNITGGELAVVNNGVWTAGKFFGRTTTVNITNGKLAFYSDAAGTTLGGTGGWVVGGGTSTININSGGVLSSPTWTVNASGGGAGGGTGTVFFDGGTLQATASSTNYLSTGTIFVRFRTNGGTIDTGANNITMGNNMNRDTAVANDGGLTKIGSGTLTLTATASTYNGPTTVNGGKLVISSATITSKAFVVASGATLQFDRATDATQTLSTLTGAGTFLKTGTGKLTLTSGSTSAQNTVNMTAGGLIDVQGGTLLASDFNTQNPTSWPSTNRGGLNIASGATFDGVLTNVVVDTLTGAGTYQAGWFGPRDLTVGSNNGSSTFSGVIRDNGSGGAAAVVNLVKTGTGALTLSGANTYAGSTNVNNGSLIVNGSIAGSSLAVRNGATLGGSGIVSTNVNVLAGGTLAPGNSPGILTINGNLNYSGGTLSVEVNGAAPGNLSSNHDQLVVNGTVTLAASGGTTLAPSIGYTPSPTDKIFFIVNDGTDAIVNSFAGLSSLSGFDIPLTITLGSGAPQSAFLSYVGDFSSGSVTGGNDAVIYFTAVPEPTSLAAIALLIAPILRRRRI
jgi:autotransporter-associated beta strand protein